MDPTPPDPYAMDITSLEATPPSNISKFDSGLGIIKAALTFPMQESLDHGIPSSPTFGGTNRRLDLDSPT